jgi:hypothetical protein
MLSPNYSPIGECLDKFLGPLCLTCMPGYTRSGSYDCKKCPTFIKSLVQIIFICLGLLSVIAIMVRSSLR